jgi:hypothetical protein
MVTVRGSVEIANDPRCHSDGSVVSEPQVAFRSTEGSANPTTRKNQYVPLLDKTIKTDGTNSLNVMRPCPYKLLTLFMSLPMNP